MKAVVRDISARLRHMAKTGRMWGSPEELETAAMHFTHVAFGLMHAAWSFEQTFARWQALGAPFSGDADEHALMRTRMWREFEEQARAQVVAGYVSVWASLARQPEREQAVGSWVETLLDQPTLAGAPDRLNMVLFSLMGFVARDASAFVAALNAERARIGGHDLRPLHVVADFGPSDAALTYGRHFTTWSAVTAAIEQFAGRLELELASQPANEVGTTAEKWSE